MGFVYFVLTYLKFCHLRAPDFMMYSETFKLKFLLRVGVFVHACMYESRLYAFITNLKAFFFISHVMWNCEKQIILVWK